MENLFFVGLGCDKNRVDGEKMLSILCSNNYNLTLDPADADIIIINTCAFIDDAIEESINTILYYSKYKEISKCKKLVVAGCLGVKYSKDISKDLPEVDLVIGPNSIDKIVQALHNDELIVLDKKSRDIPYSENRIITTNSFYEYLKIADGCNKCCSYCAIPSIRGKYRSYEIENLVKEAKMLASKGIKEIILVAQETTLYGVDIYKKKSLVDLIKKISDIDGIEFIRIMYTYPEEIDKDLITEIKNNDKVCNYIDMPIQHVNNTILHNMGRKATKEDIIEKINYLRSEINDIVLRTTVMTGFPGEDEYAHNELLDFINTYKFDRLGVFKFQPQPNTKASQMFDFVDEKTKDKRYEEIMLLEQKVIFDKNKLYKDKVIKGIIEGKFDNDNSYVVRGYMNAPDIDLNIYAKSNNKYNIGDIINIKISDSDNYDLIGEII